MPPRQPGLAGLDAWVRSHPGVLDAVLAVAFAVVLLPSSATLVWSATWPSPPRAALLALLLLAHAAVAASRRSPRAAFAVCNAVMLVLALTPDLRGEGTGGLASQAVPPVLLPSCAVYLVVLHAVAQTRPPWPARALGVALAGAALVTARLWVDTDWITGSGSADGWGWRLFVVLGLVAAVLAPWGLGRFRAVRAAYVEALEERARRAEREQERRAEQAVLAERARIAREMHDVVAHSLAVIVRQAEGGRLIAAKDPQRAAHVLSAVAGAGREALADMRTALGALHPGEEPADAPQPTAGDVPALVERVRAAGLPVDLAVTGEAADLDRVVSLAAYRVVQEALTNVVKHAGAGAAARVHVRWGAGEVRVEVTDDGTGAPGRGGDAGRDGDAERDGDTERDGDAGPGRGLLGMRERVALAGGRLEAGPAGGGGFHVAADLPTRGPGTAEPGAAAPGTAGSAP
ncbi:hypothetical protein NUM3379_27220 [Kineococcus sp. NUM-3379]